MKSKLLLIAILFIAACLRLYKLGDLPRGLYIDEVSIGYNAWSVLNTGRDEHQNVYPLQFPAFGEYKLPVYIYGSMPIIAIFGLNALSVRLLSAICGIISVWGIYLLTKKIFIQQHYWYTESTALIAAAFLASSPWSLQFSRGGFEANVAAMFVIFAVYFLLSYLQAKTISKHNLIFSTLCCIAALYTYNAERIFLPLFLIVIFLVFNKELFNPMKRKTSLIGIAVIVLVLGITMYASVFGNESARIKQVFELGNKQYYLGPFLGVTQKYLTHFSSDFLFFEGDILARHSVRELGELFLSQLPFLLLGLYILARNNSKESKVVLAWLLLAPLPAGLATPVPHALRSLLMVIPLTIATAVGITSLITWLRNRRYTYNSILLPLLKTTMVICFGYSLFTYLHVYYKHYVYKTSWDWGEHQTLLGQTLAKDYSTAGKILIETDPKAMEYIKFYNAAQNRLTNESKYVFYTQDVPVKPQNGDIVVINGWKGTPEQFKNPQELKMLNTSIGFKIGEWQE